MYIRHHWAKFDRKPSDSIHLLEHHLADVGACFEALLAQPTIRRRLAHAGGLNDLDDATVARLSVFAALHDIGKLNVGFQTQIWRRADLPQGKRKPNRAGHTQDLAPILNGNDAETGKWFFDAIRWNDFLTWDKQGGETACGLLLATFSHHGRPLQLEGGRSRNPRIWRDFCEISPSSCAERIGGLLCDWFPEAFVGNGSALPSAPAFQHMFLGLCALADWIGSNECFFPFVGAPQSDYIDRARENAKRAITSIGLNISAQREAFTAAQGFADLFNFDTPNAIQEAAAQDTPLEERVVVIESETGSGKTEAALWRFARMYERGLVDGIYFALPTRAAAAQIHRRVKRFAANLFAGQDVPHVVLAVPGYGADADSKGAELQVYDEHAAGETHHEKPWASENSKRYLAAQIAVGTVDQAMMGALKVRHAHIRAACLARNLLVVDEVHASDAYMRRILEALLEAHIGAGSYALLMSATLGSDARRRLLSASGAFPISDDLPICNAIEAPYPAISASGKGIVGVGDNGRTKGVRVSVDTMMHDFDSVAEHALNAARAGAKTLVVRNTVGHAIQTQQALERMVGERDKRLLFSLNSINTLHHGRFSAHDRRLLDRRVEDYFGKDARPSEPGCIVVGTQTLEQSLDIDADLLITDLCPMDVLLQRIGRLHRHERDDRPVGYRTPACIVLTPPGNDLSPLLTSGEHANGLGPRGYVYPDLRVLDLTRRLITEHAEWDIPRMNRELVERATHPDALEKIVQSYERQDTELGGWRAHANDIEGERIADGLTAKGATIRRDKSFFLDNRDVLFGSQEERIRTRLGDERVDISFDTPQDSPFGQASAIDKLALSIRWLDGAEVPETVEATVTEIDGGFEFAVGSKLFRYDRLGLHRL